MPRYDGTGPAGEGPLTGGGAGDCISDGESTRRGLLGFGFGRGLGRRGRGLRGAGFGRNIRIRGGRGR